MEFVSTPLRQGRHRCLRLIHAGTSGLVAPPPQARCTRGYSWREKLKVGPCGLIQGPWAGAGGPVAQNGTALGCSQLLQPGVGVLYFMPGDNVTPLGKSEEPFLTVTVPQVTRSSEGKTSSATGQVTWASAPSPPSGRPLVGGRWEWGSRVQPSSARLGVTTSASQGDGSSPGPSHGVWQGRERVRFGRLSKETVIGLG